jgi:Xaa-Pro aminopeptidase
MQNLIKENNMITKEEFAKRRKKLFAKMQINSIAIVPSALEYERSGDATFPFRQNGNFYYLTGFDEPEAVAIFVKNKKECKYILFNRKRNSAMEQWFGFRVGQNGAVKQLGADEAYPIDELDQRLPTLLQGRDILYYLMGWHSDFDAKINSILGGFQGNNRSSRIKPPVAIIQLSSILHEMRLHKSAAEIKLMQKAANITVDAFKKVMRACKPNMYEYELGAILKYEYYRQGAGVEAFPSIVAGGKNSCILHHDKCESQLKNGDLVLIDAGCEYKYYSSDITRTFPINGKFTKEQKAIYEIALEMQRGVINKIKPGITFDVLQETAAHLITAGLRKIGILKGNLKKLIADKAYEPFYMHAVSHWLGIDAHDVGEYRIANKWRKLEAGMVFTVEPGIYIKAGMKNVAKKWWNIGIRIEDDVLVTKNGNRVLTAALPKSVAEIEGLMQK